MFLKTDRLTIRHIEADDWKSIRDIWLDLKSSEYAWLVGTENVSFYKDAEGNDIVFEGGIFELII